MITGWVNGRPARKGVAPTRAELEMEIMRRTAGGCPLRSGRLDLRHASQKNAGHPLIPPHDRRVERWANQLLPGSDRPPSRRNSTSSRKPECAARTVTLTPQASLSLTSPPAAAASGPIPDPRPWPQTTTQCRHRAEFRGCTRDSRAAAPPSSGSRLANAAGYRRRAQAAPSRRWSASATPPT